MARVQNEQMFPDLEVPAVGGGKIDLPHDLDGSYGVVLIYRGHWCPFCNEQMAAFVAAAPALEQAGIKVVAFSADGEAATKEFVAKHHIAFQVGHSADLAAVVAATGAYQGEAPGGGRHPRINGFRARPRRNRPRRRLLEPRDRSPRAR